MATTARRFELLVNGMRDTTGAVVASGKVRWYSPGTLTPATAYSDAACTTPETAPLTLSAGGTGTLYFLEPVRVIIKDSTETTTYYDDIPALNRHDSVYITHTAFNGGAETTLENLLTDLNTSTGGGVNTKPVAAATARGIKAVIYERMVSVTDWAADSTGATDASTAIQAASDYIESLGGGIVFFPEGTYLCNSTLSIDTAGVNWRGAGRGSSILKNGSTSNNLLSINMGSAIDCKLFLRDFSITASTTSSGSGIVVTNGDRVSMKNVSVALHRTAIDVSGVTSAQLDECWIESTDDNAAAFGIKLGIRGRVRNTEVLSGTDNGTGIVASGVDGRVEDCYVSNFATGVSLTGARASVVGGHVSSATTGISLGAANTKALRAYVASCTTGVSVGAFASCVVEGCDGASNTTDLSVNSSATLFREHNSFTGTITNTGSTPQTYPDRRKRTMTTDATTTVAFTPVHDPNLCQVLYMTAAGALSSITIGAPTTTGIAQPGEEIEILLVRAAATGGGVAVTWNAAFRNATDLATITAGGTCAAGRAVTYRFLWNGSVYINMDTNVGDAATGWLI